MNAISSKLGSVVFTGLVYSPFVVASTTFFGSVAMVGGPNRPDVGTWAARTWGRSICEAARTKVDVIGKENIIDGQSYIVMANHLSYFDVFAILGHLPLPLRFVIKQELRKIPFLGESCYRTGHIFVDRTNTASAVKSLKVGAVALDRFGLSLVVFPEGTRSRDGSPGLFKKGGFVTAMTLGRPILPIRIEGSNGVMPARGFLVSPGGHITLTIGRAIQTDGLGPADLPELMERVAQVLSRTRS